MHSGRHTIHQYNLTQGALEVQYIEEYFDEFRKRKTADEIIQRLSGRDHLILLSMAPNPDGDDDRLIPVAFKVGHELTGKEKDAPLSDLVCELHGSVNFDGRRVFYSWIGGTRIPWRGRGHYRALTEQQEQWALERGYHELLVKTKNRFYAMRATLAQLQFEVIGFNRNLSDTSESRVYLSKKLSPGILDGHKTSRYAVEVV
jgi:hypothetical protein